MRRAHGERGTFVARQVARGLGGELFPAMLPLNDRALESSLAVVTLTQEAREKARRRVPGRPVLPFQPSLAARSPPPARRRHLGLPADAHRHRARAGHAAKRLDLWCAP
jgi:hypothetical protein